MFTGPPKPFTGNLKEMKLTAVLHSDVTLQFLAQEYFDEENNTIFTWYNQNSSLHNGGRKYILSSFGLQSTLIIRNMTQSDFGQYRVEVKNSIGHYIHYYKLQEKGNDLYIRCFIDSLHNRSNHIYCIDIFYLKKMCLVK
jgi:hypothetical protein